MTTYETTFHNIIKHNADSCEKQSFFLREVIGNNANSFHNSIMQLVIIDKNIIDIRRGIYTASYIFDRIVDSEHPHLNSRPRNGHDAEIAAARRYFGGQHQ